MFQNNHEDVKRRGIRCAVVFAAVVAVASFVAPAVAGECGGPGQKPCADHQCAEGLAMGEEGVCHASLADVGGARVQAEASTSPDYKIVCVSSQRLGDCGEWFTVTANTAGQIGDDSYLWTLYDSYNGACPSGGSTQQPQNPLYDIVCVSDQRLGDCGEWFNVVATSTGSIGGESYLWLLYSKYNGSCP